MFWQVHHLNPQTTAKDMEDRGWSSAKVQKLQVGSIATPSWLYITYRYMFYCFLFIYLNTFPVAIHLCCPLHSLYIDYTCNYVHIISYWSVCLAFVLRYPLFQMSLQISLLIFNPRGCTDICPLFTPYILFSSLLYLVYV